MAEKPIETLNLSPLSAAIWKNTTKEGKSWFSVTFSRNYRDEGGNWKSSDSFSGSDLLLLAKLADQAHTRAEQLRKAEGKADEGAA